MDSVGGLVEWKQRKTSFNSIEWIQLQSELVDSINAYNLLSIPLNGFFNPVRSPEAEGVVNVLSIPLNGFTSAVSSHHLFPRSPSFNSIEWILARPEFCSVVEKLKESFNSIEWIH